MQRLHQTKTGFTLIELLVVIAIIAILAAILFPVFAQAREKARQTACLSNQKQIGTALMMYAQDYDEYLPTRYGDRVDPTDNHVITWKDMLVPYIKNRDVYKCPSNPSAQKKDNWGVFPGGYAMWLPDAWLSGQMGHGAGYPQALAGIERPADSLIILEHSFVWTDTGPYLWYAEPAPSDVPEVNPGPSTWNSGHNKKKGNIVYMDGHAKYRALKDTFNEDGGLNQWRYSKEEMDAKGLDWLSTLLIDLQKYPAND